MPVPTTVADLDPVAANNYPTGSESVGPNLDDYLRAHAAIIKQVSNSIAPAISAVIPAGVIMMWSGAVGAIPAGWRLCDGGGGTPDLRNRFVVGAGSSYAVGATGGADTVTLTAAQMPAHAHAGTTNGAGGHTHSVYDPGHVHGNGGSRIQNLIGGTSGAYVRLNTEAADTTDAAATGIAIYAVGDHLHSFATDTRGSGAAHENRPPYYALCYIMKT